MTAETHPISPKRGFLQQTAVVLEMIKFQHTIFALPFALAAMLLANRSIPAPATVFWIIVASVAARTAAMAFNRWLDADIDALNPRTSNRAIPAGLLSPTAVLGWVIVSSILFVLAAAMLNPLALSLTPVALAVLLGYSYCKRFTVYSHFVLGLALAIAPSGAWIAVTGTLGIIPILISTGVLIWTAGFDLIYACQDIDFDRHAKLRSIPACIGATKTLLLARVLHLFTIAAFAGAGIAMSAGGYYFAGIAVIALLLTAMHVVVRADDTRSINIAFFTINSWIGVVFLVAVIAEIYFPSSNLLFTR